MKKAKVENRILREIAIDDAGYPKKLKEIYDPPKRLYVNGTLTPEDEVAVALVGSRRATQYGLEMSEKFGYELAIRGVTVVSGMARGIDSAAHRGALKAKGRTIAVLGSGHDHIYPPENKELYEEIATSGAVVSEFENDVPPLPYNFPKRNRIISGLSLGVVVVEAARNSGALITANLALEQGREVFAVPGKISSHTSGGTNELIKEGAKLIQSLDDILEELSLVQRQPLAGTEKRAKDEKITRMTKAYMYNSLTESERKVYKALADEPKGVDEIVTAVDEPPQEVLSVLLSLELKKLVVRRPGGNYVVKDIPQNR